MTTATSLNELQQQIRDRYDSLSKRLQQVSRYVLDNTNSVAFDTVAVIAERAGVPPSTLIRFANAFDFSGFNEMKQLFRMNPWKRPPATATAHDCFVKWKVKRCRKPRWTSCRNLPVRMRRPYSSWRPALNPKCWYVQYNCWQMPTRFTSLVYDAHLA